ncbi:MAG: hypothetical protein NTZ85_14245 [Bacteroidia bacterium]|nr:hypothetical protein [Bacteroidia bacterium]
MKTDQKFLNELYTIKNIQKESVNKLTIQVELKRDHDIFKGHFPGNPILPGVCTIQILKELLSFITPQTFIVLSHKQSLSYWFLTP